VEREVITLCSMMRNSMGYIDRYFNQVSDLQDLIPELRVVVGEGDHIDQTAELLRSHPYPAEVVDVSHGGARYGSIDHPQRWDDIAKSVRGVLDHVGDPGQFLIWVESDLIWRADTMLKLIANAQARITSCPMVYADNTRRFYDTWGYRVNGQLFNPQEPHWDGSVVWAEDSLVKIDSCGSCFVTSRDGYDELESWTGHWPYKSVNLWLDTKTEVYHP
jgi:hypothetical protein